MIIQTVADLLIFQASAPHGRSPPPAPGGRRPRPPPSAAGGAAPGRSTRAWGAAWAARNGWGWSSQKWWENHGKTMGKQGKQGEKDELPTVLQGF